MAGQDMADSEAGRFDGVKVVVMGLGLNGGGTAAARHFASKGAELVITDIKPKEELAVSLAALNGYKYKFIQQKDYTLDDVQKNDILIKNPAVPWEHPWLAAARRIETDVSIFLAHNKGRLTAVTGSKGKSTTAAAVHYALEKAKQSGLLPGRAFLGGNIRRSPLEFIDQAGIHDDVVLELSSFQLGDIVRYAKHPRALLKPACAIFTAILPDHLDRYHNDMAAYIADKRALYAGQDQSCATIAQADGWGLSFLAESRGRPFRYGDTPPPGNAPGAWLDGLGGAGIARLPSGETVEVAPASPRLPGRHHKKNLLAAALALLDRGLPSGFIREALGGFGGLEHRMEFFHESGGVRFYNDSAATLPHAVKAAMESFDTPVILVAGGRDKNLDFAPLVEGAARAKAIVLLSGSRGEGGTGTAKLLPLLHKRGLPVTGPFDSPQAAAAACLQAAAPGDSVILSPGCASFDMFDNEFDRGEKWKAAVLKATADTH
ncbi:MAG: UDP-N-acetylmuramoyl-L-alanine--D-glutamate ligase [Spirochaetaceae bacterium]|jgi:UDP-N-acetylmuramoylalanine--D-glutamate ligase|nr:UDP-N-acetylmuramoyl-L-alanine--D-glutamate ligase [Spirochaetaceae bacterium]